MKKFLIATTVITIIAMASAVDAKGRKETLALQFLGTDTAADWDELSTDTVSTIEDLAAGNNDFNVSDLDGFGCFELDLVDPSSGVVVGVGVDCLAPDGQDDGVIVEAFSFFILPGGAFASNGMTSVRPFYAGVGDAGGEFTHMTGSLPDGDNIIAGTGQFKDTGATRVSGAINLSQFGDGVISFNCLWIAVVKIRGDE